MGGEYQAAYARAAADPEGFWAEAAEALDWQRRWDRVLDDARPPFYRWFSGGQLNTCHNAVDRHVAAGRGGQLAIIHDSPVTDTVRTLTFAELQDQVARFAGVLRAQGVGHGDRVIVYMPMVPEALIAMLGCARIGAVHSVVFGGFAAHELAARIDDAKPKLVVSATCGIEGARVIPYQPLLDGAIAAAAHKPERCLILARPAGRGRAGPGPRSRLARSHGGGDAGGLRAGRRDRPALHPLHLGHHGPAQGHRARPRRPRGGASLDA